MTLPGGRWWRRRRQHLDHDTVARDAGPGPGGEAPMERVSWSGRSTLAPRKTVKPRVRPNTAPITSAAPTEAVSTASATAAYTAAVVTIVTTPRPSW